MDGVTHHNSKGFEKQSWYLQLQLWKGPQLELSWHLLGHWAKKNMTGDNVLFHKRGEDNFKSCWQTGSWNFLGAPVRGCVYMSDIWVINSFTLDSIFILPNELFLFENIYITLEKALWQMRWLSSISRFSCLEHPYF